MIKKDAMENIKQDVTDRGFQMVAFNDIYGFDCSIQQSSLATNEVPETGALWIGRRSERMHLDATGVKAMVEYLQVWLDHGKLF